MRVLVTGGTGYIGAHTVRLLEARGDHVVVVDDVVTGNRDRVPGVPIVDMNLASDCAEALSEVMRDYRIDAVIHFAGQKQVAESLVKPAWYYLQNVASVAQVLDD